MEIVKSFIISILAAAFIVNIVNMILPSSKLKSYINLVLGFIFILIVITPVINFFSKDLTLEDRLLKTYAKYNKEYIDSMNELSSDTGDSSIKVGYEDGLKSILKLKLDEYGYELDDIEFDGSKISNIKVSEKNTKSNIDKKTQDKQKEQQVFKEKTEDNNKEEVKESLGNILDISIDNIEID